MSSHTRAGRRKSLAALEASGLTRLVVAGGVGANARLRERLDAGCARRGVRVHYPELALCTAEPLPLARRPRFASLIPELALKRGPPQLGCYGARVPAPDRFSSPSNPTAHPAFW